MSFGDTIFDFYQHLSPPKIRLKDFRVMLPFETKTVKEINRNFYKRYYGDNHPRVFLIGINPGRFGGGITGIPFTDPVNLEEVLGIKNNFVKKHELSSQFVYEVIKELGGAERFFGSLYLTAVSPVGFVLKNKNINYYEVKQIRDNWEQFFADSMMTQIQAGGNTEKAFMLGQGENMKYMRILNDKYRFFQELLPLPHPRWIMQYRYRRREEFLNLYVEILHRYIRN